MWLYWSVYFWTNTNKLHYNGTGLTLFFVLKNKKSDLIASLNRSSLQNAHPLAWVLSHPEDTLPHIRWDLLDVLLQLLLRGLINLRFFSAYQAFVWSPFPEKVTGSLWDSCQEWIWLLLITVDQKLFPFFNASIALGGKEMKCKCLVSFDFLLSVLLLLFFKRVVNIDVLCCLLFPLHFLQREAASGL